MTLSQGNEWIGASGAGASDPQALDEPVLDITGAETCEHGPEHAMPPQHLVPSSGEAFYRCTLDLLCEGVVEVSQSGTILYENTGFASLVGRQPAETVGRPIETLVCPTDGESFRRILERMLGGDGGRARISLLRSDGGRIPVRLEARQVTEHEEARVGVMVATDLTAEERIERLAMSEQLTRSILEQTLEGIVICDPKGGVVRANAEAQKLCGASPVLRAFEDAFPMEAMPTPDVAERRPHPLHLEEVLRGDSLRGIEARLRQGNGCMVPVLVTAGPFYGAGGALLGCVVTLSDLSERQRAEEDRRQLAETRTRLAAIVESSDEAIIGKTPEGIITNWNRAAERMYGYTAEEAVGQPVSILAPPERQEEQRSLIARLCAGEAVRCETVRVRKGGARLDVALTAFPIRSEQGRIVGVSAIARDITAQNRAAAALARESRTTQLVAELAVSLLGCGPLEEVSDLVLEAARTLTDSAAGMAGYLEPDSGHLIVPVLSRTVWEPCRVPDKSLRFQHFGGMEGWVLNHAESVLSNSPASDPRSIGTPDKHVPFERFLGVPAKAGTELVGILSVVNAPRDYNAGDQQILERLAAYYAIAVTRHRSESRVGATSE